MLPELEGKGGVWVIRAMPEFKRFSSLDVFPYLKLKLDGMLLFCDAHHLKRVRDTSTLTRDIYLILFSVALMGGRLSCCIFLQER